MPYAPPIHRPWKQGKARHLMVKNRQKRRAMHTGSKAWKAIRAWVLIRDSYTCAVCGRYGDQVDHIDGDDSNNPPDGSNWQTLCHSDHSAKTMRELNKARR